MTLSASCPLPLGRITAYVKHCEDNHGVALDCKVHGVRKALEECPSDAGAQMLILEGTVGDAVIGRTKLMEEFQPKP